MIRMSVRENVSQASFLGIDLTFQYSDLLIPFMLMLRWVMAWIFLWAGLDKLFTGFTSAGFLVNGTSGPLKDYWVSLGQSSNALAVIDPLVIWGEILIGLALFFGVFTRLALFFGGVQMFIFYLAQFPPEHNPFLDYFLVYLLVFAMLGALGAGRILGLDKYVERWRVIRRSPGLKYLLG